MFDGVLEGETQQQVEIRGRQHALHLPLLQLRQTVGSRTQQIGLSEERGWLVERAERGEGRSCGSRSCSRRQRVGQLAQDSLQVISQTSLANLVRATVPAGLALSCVSADLNQRVRAASSHFATLRAGGLLLQ